MDKREEYQIEVLSLIIRRGGFLQDYLDQDDEDNLWKLADQYANSRVLEVLERIEKAYSEPIPNATTDTIESNRFLLTRLEIEEIRKELTQHNE